MELENDVPSAVRALMKRKLGDKEASTLAVRLVFRTESETQQDNFSMATLLISVVEDADIVSS